MLHRNLRDILRHQHLCYLPMGASVRTAATEMSRRHIAAVLVVDEDDALRGIFTERDVLDRVLMVGRNPDTTPLSDVMTHDPLTIAAHQTVRTAIAELKANGVRHLPVVDGDRLVGIVSMRDFLADEVAELDHERAFAAVIWETIR